MKITVKLLQGPERVIEVLPSMSLGDLKNLVEKDFNLCTSSQKLLYNGRALLDAKKTLGDYNVKDGGRITLFTAKAHASPQVASCSTVEKATTPKFPSPPRNMMEGPDQDPDLHAALVKEFQEFFSQSDSVKIVNEFFRDFKAKIALLSLDDIERLAGQYLETDFQQQSE